MKTSLKYVFGLSTILGVGSLVLVGSPVQAAMGTQPSSASAFTTTGTSSSASSPVSLSFTRFDPASVPAGRTNIKLVGYEYEITLGSISGTLKANYDTSPAPPPPNSITVGANGTFHIRPLTPLVGSDVTIGSFPATFAGNPVPNNGTNVFLAASGSATGVSSQQLLPTVNDPNYIAPPATSVTANSYFTSWTITPSDVNLLTNSGAGMKVNGNVRVNWLYTYDSSEVPAPMPLLGAGVAFGMSRRLRRRISARI